MSPHWKEKFEVWYTQCGCVCVSTAQSVCARVRRCVYFYSQQSRVCQSSLFSGENTSWLGLLSELTPSYSLFFFFVFLSLSSTLLFFSSKLFTHLPITFSLTHWNHLKDNGPCGLWRYGDDFFSLCLSGCFSFVRKSEYSVTTRKWLLRAVFFAFIIYCRLCLLPYIYVTFT